MSCILYWYVERSSSVVHASTHTHTRTHTHVRTSFEIIIILSIRYYYYHRFYYYIDSSVTTSGRAASGNISYIVVTDDAFVGRCQNTRNRTSAAAVNADRPTDRHMRHILVYGSDIHRRKTTKHLRWATSVPRKSRHTHTFPRLRFRSFKIRRPSSPTRHVFWSGMTLDYGTASRAAQLVERLTSSGDIEIDRVKLEQLENICK